MFAKDKTTDLGNGLARVRSCAPRRRAAVSTNRFERGDVLREARCELFGEVRIVEVGVGPCLRHSTPIVSSTEEGADGGVVPERPAPLLLTMEQVRDHHVVLAGLRMLGVEPDLQREHPRPGDVVGSDRLRLVVLTRRCLGTEPELDPVTAGPPATPGGRRGEAGPAASPPRL